MSRGIYIIVTLISISASIFTSVISNYYIEKNKQITDDKFSLNQISSIPKQENNQEIDQSVILSQKGRIVEIKNDELIINTPEKEKNTVIINKDTVYATYSPNAEADGLPTKLSELQIGNMVEIFLETDIKGKDTITAQMIKYTIDNENNALLKNPSAKQNSNTR